MMVNSSEMFVNQPKYKKPMKNWENWEKPSQKKESCKQL